MGKLADTKLRSLKADTKDQLHCDGGGLYLRNRSSGTKTWLYRYTKNNQQTWIGLGSYPDISLADARLIASTITANRKKGVDPADERKKVAAKKISEHDKNNSQSSVLTSKSTVLELFEHWLEVDLIRRKDKGVEVSRMFKKDVLPAIGCLQVKEIRKGQINQITDKLLTRNVPRMAKVILSLVRQMFRFAVDRDIIEADPTAAIRKAKIGGPAVERDRVMSEAEIMQLTRALPEAGLIKSTEIAVWIALATCCRIGELLSARWEHVDLEMRTWRIPEEHSKNGKSHEIYLSEFAVNYFKIIDEIAKLQLQKENMWNTKAQPSLWIYPNRTRSGPVCSKTVTKQLSDRQRTDRLPMSGRAKQEYSNSLVLPRGKWTPHDLRRTGATLMVSLGILPEVAERCLNHTEKDRIKRTYQRHTYENEMREAWKLLGDKLSKLTEAGVKFGAQH